MIIKIKGRVLGMPCDQWCELLSADRAKLRVRSLGNDEEVTILPSEITGVRLTENYSIDVLTTKSRWTVSSPIRSNDQCDLTD